jgi:hypothetical protein
MKQDSHRHEEIKHQKASSRPLGLTIRKFPASSEKRKWKIQISVPNCAVEKNKKKKGIKVMPNANNALDPRLPNSKWK